MLEAQVNEEFEVMTQRTGMPTFTFKVLGEYPEADWVILIIWAFCWSSPGFIWASLTIAVPEGAERGRTASAL